MIKASGYFFRLLYFVGYVNRQEVKELMISSRALIYPSTFESLGLPLLEAKSVDLKIIAPELDYVREVLDPAESFDPNSAISIKRAVKRFLGKKEERVNIVDAEDFLRKITTQQGFSD